MKAVNDGLTLRLSGTAADAVEEIGRLLGRNLTPGQIVGLSLGTELYLARLAVERGEGTVWIESGKYRQKLTVAERNADGS